MFPKRLLLETRLLEIQNPSGRGTMVGVAIEGESGISLFHFKNRNAELRDLTQSSAQLTEVGT